MLIIFSCAFIMPATNRSCAAEWVLWQGDRVALEAHPPAGDLRAASLTQRILARYLNEFFARALEPNTNRLLPRIRVVLGTPANNPTLEKLVASGLELGRENLGDEGFQLRTWEHGDDRYLILYGLTPRALKHACQELLFYQVQADAQRGWIEAPLHVTRKPAMRYRGIYMLPCWAAHDSVESWERVLRFNSELTLNRNWFWLDSFPIAGHTGEYAGTDLANPTKVQHLFNVAAAEEMNIAIGGGWHNWHHAKAVGHDLAQGREYYLAYLKYFTNFHGFYIEPTGEGRETDRWQAESDSLCQLIRQVLEQRPDFEFALAIGKFNNPQYLRRMSQWDPQRVFWWWCWGDPIRDRALDLYPSVLRWHLSQAMSEYHGAIEPPEVREQALTGMATSYDPGQGFGNPWSGWAAMGTDRPRNFHPHTVPYFGQQYFFRERCWQLDLTEAQFVERLQRRLFDAWAPAEAGKLYWQLSRMAQRSVRKDLPSEADLAAVSRLVGTLRERPATARMADTIARMDEALSQLRQRMRGSK